MPPLLRGWCSITALLWQHFKNMWGYVNIKRPPWYLLTFFVVIGMNSGSNTLSLSYFKMVTFYNNRQISSSLGQKLNTMQCLLHKSSSCNQIQNLKCWQLRDFRRELFLESLQLVITTASSLCLSCKSGSRR